MKIAFFQNHSQMNKIGFTLTVITCILFIVSFSVEKVETSACLSSTYINRECLNNSTCVSVIDVEPWCSCNLPYKGINCEQCLCFLINQTCSIYGESICKPFSNSTLYISAYSLPFWVWILMLLPIEIPVCLLICYCFLYTCIRVQERFKYSDLCGCICDLCICIFFCPLGCIWKVVQGIFKCKCNEWCYSTPAVRPTASVEPTRHSVNQNRPNNSMMQNEQILIEQQIIRRTLINTIRKTPCNSIDTKINDNSPSCVICLSSLNSSETVETIYCGHTFHKECILSWFNEKPTNPICPFRCNRETNNESLNSINANINNESPMHILPIL